MSAVFLHFEQPFEKFWYHGLLFKLKSFLSSFYNLILKFYLNERYFSDSEEWNTPIPACVSQGTVASTTFFNLYSAEQSNHQNTQICEYADDSYILHLFQS